MSQIPHISPFDGIRHKDEHGKEYWSARELGKLFGYGEYRKFKNAIEKAEEACKNSGQAVSDHFVHLHGMVGIGSRAKRKVEDVHLTRYARYKYSSGRISTYLQNHSRAFSQYANHWLGFVVPPCQAAGARTNSTGTLPIIFNVI